MGGKKSSNKLVAGVGVNDLPYTVGIYEQVDGKNKQKLCPFYNRWKDVLTRTHPDYTRKSGNNYLGSSVHESWLYASNFKAWMETQNWKGLHLDKDILVKGNKQYGPNTCAFVPAWLNTCLSVNNGNNNGLAFGVQIDKRVKKEKSKKFRSDVNLLNGKREFLGQFHTEKEAHAVWQLARARELEKYISKYAQEECFRTDVAEALMKRVWNLRLENANGVETKSL